MKILLKQSTLTAKRANSRSPLQGIFVSASLSKGAKGCH
jgi:hypothetical protein